MLILTNLKCQEYQEIFQDLKQWLHQTAQTPQETLIQLRDQLCAGFFLIFCSNFQNSFDYLKKVENSLAAEYFEALKSELEKREQENKNKLSKNILINPNSDIKNKTITEKLQFIFLFLKEMALNLLEKMKIRHGLLVAAIKSNTKNFLIFCKTLLKIILRKFKIIL